MNCDSSNPIYCRDSLCQFQIKISAHFSMVILLEDDSDVKHQQFFITLHMK